MLNIIIDLSLNTLSTYNVIKGLYELYNDLDFIKNKYDKYIFIKNQYLNIKNSKYKKDTTEKSINFEKDCIKIHQDI